MIHGKLDRYRLKKLLEIFAILIVVVICVVIYSLLKDVLKYGGNFEIFLIFFLGLFSWMIAIVFRRETLLRINEQTVLSITLSFFYIFLIQYYSSVVIKIILIAVLAILLLAGAIVPVFNYKLGIGVWLLIFFYGVSVLTGSRVLMDIMALSPFVIPAITILIITFTKYRLSTTQKNLFYGWFLFMIILVSLSQIKLELMGSFFIPYWDNYEVLFTELIEVFLLGMLFVYLNVNFMHLVMFLGNYRSRYVDGVHSVYEEGENVFRESKTKNNSSGTIDEYFSNYQLSPIQSLLIILIQGGVFVLNYYFKFIQDHLLITISIIFVPLFISKLYPYKV